MGPTKARLNEGAPWNVSVSVASPPKFSGGLGIIGSHLNWLEVV